MGDVSKKRLTNCLRHGTYSAIASALLMTSCKPDCVLPLYYKTDAENRTATMLVLRGEAKTSYTFHFETKLTPNERATVLPFWTDDNDSDVRSISLITQDSVIEVRNGHNDDLGKLTTDIVFQVKPDPLDRLSKVVVFSDEYLAELSDTMRKRGIPPYPISHEYVVNNTRQDFTLRCVSAERTWEYEIASGDSADIERRWLMEWHGTEGGHYEFVFADRTMTVWPAEIFGFSLRDVVRGHKAIPRRYFDFTVSREGGGMRRYEITDTLLRQIAAEMAKVRKAQPGLFGR